MFRSLSDYADTIGADLEADPDLCQLVTAERRSGENIEASRDFVRAELRGTQGIDIVAFGSLARMEWTDNSDFDYLVLVHGLEIGMANIRKALVVAEELRAKLEAEPPGPTGTFGVVVSASDLIARLGLETDTNQTLTRRLLVFEESVSLFDVVQQSALVRTILQRYLVEYEGRDQKRGVPRFLINDVVRHWRTVAVDYQAKNWQRPTDEGWGLRYLKLRISRKLSFAGTVAPLLALGPTDSEPTVERLLAELEPPALCRLANLHPLLHSDGQAALLEALRIAGRFNRHLNSGTFRQQANAVLGHQQEYPDDVEAALRDAEALQDHLTTIYSSRASPLHTFTDKYLVF